ncbi:MAG: alpha/beta fold hydrolase [Candidatus Phosphoribacter sp.]
MKESAPIQPPNESNNPCTETLLPPEFVQPPFPLVVNNSESRLNDNLRLAAQNLRDAAILNQPNDILVRAAVAYRLQGPELGNPLADLAVTGRWAYTAFKSAPPTDATLAALTSARLADVEHVRATPQQVAEAVSLTLDRAFAVAWAVRGPAAQAKGRREKLGWIAVSGEDDTPHRPVNVPSPPFEQFDLEVTVTPRTKPVPVKVMTRFFIASAAEESVSPGIAASNRALPPDPVPRIPDGHEVILFLHGHSSSADEALPIIPELLRAGLRRGAKLSVISFDLPNSGYAQTFSHKDAAESGDTTYPGGIFDGEKVRTPILDFEEDFVVAFVNALDRVTPVKSRFAGVIGGSLGGNLGLRLGRRPDLAANPWLNAGIVSWSPASVWKPMIRNEVLRHGPDRCRDHWDLPELPTSRVDYFAEVFDRFIDPTFVRTKQPQYWYSKDWTPCKQLSIEGARIARREIYSANYRQWHWRLAGEQLIYSHIDRTDHFDDQTPERYKLNTVRQLLMAGADDNYDGIEIYDRTRELAKLMVNTPGESLFLLHTGHSMHVERPVFVAEEIVKFLSPRQARSRTSISFVLPLLLSEAEVPPPRRHDTSFLSVLLLSEAEVPPHKSHDTSFLSPLLLSGAG